MRNNTSFLSLLTVAVSVLFAPSVQSQGADQYRTWTDSTGKHKVEAAFLSLEDGQVHLKRKDNGKTFSVPVRRMSREDLALVRKMVREAEPSAETSAATSGSSDAGSQAKKKAWTGTWNNRKYGTDGPVTCIATVINEKTWKASFVGKGLGKPFKYEVTITATQKGNQMQLEGTSKVDGDTYRWSGYVRDKALYGRYRSGSGNNGEFQLKETRVPAATAGGGKPARRRSR